MKIEVLIAIRSKGKKDILAALDSIGLMSDALVYVYHYNGTKKDSFRFGNHNVTVFYGGARTKIEAYNWLLLNAGGDYISFLDLSDRLLEGYANHLTSIIQRNLTADGVLFSCSKEIKRVRSTMVKNVILSNLWMKKETVKQRGLAFIDVYDPHYFSGSTQLFVKDFTAWPSRCVGTVKPATTSVKGDCLDTANYGFFDARRFGYLWPLICFARFSHANKEEPIQFKPFFLAYRRGYLAYAYRGFENENKPLKLFIFPFIVSCIAMVGLATQLVLSLLIVFTEVQYIPIWVSLTFIVSFAVTYALASPRIHNVKAILINGFSTAALSFVVGFLTFLALGVSWAMSLYGAFICGTIIAGLTYCFAPRRIKRP